MNPDPSPDLLTTSDLAEFIRGHGIQAEILHLPVETPTVEAAAQALGTSPDRIVKSLLFLVDRSPVLVIARGMSLVSRRRLASQFHLSPKRVKLADPGTTLATTGYPVGALPPFGHASPLPTLLDLQVLAGDEVFAGGGSAFALLRVRAQEIARVTCATTLDLVEREESPGP
jgi:prolyl-tRNA editing enzyme YbaK/EbsC (Cys-tRNA(Pro) deacylase)